MKHFAKSPADGVPHDGVADLLGDGEAEARMPEAVLEGVYREQPAPVGETAPVRPVEVWRIRYPCAAAPGQVPKNLDCKLLATAPPARGDDPTATDRTHALAETVRLRTLATIRLIRSLHAAPLSIRDLQTRFVADSHAYRM